MKFLLTMSCVSFFYAMFVLGSVVGMEKEQDGRDLSVWTYEKKNSRWMLKETEFKDDWKWENLNIKEYLKKNGVNENHMPEFEDKRSGLSSWRFCTFKKSMKEKNDDRSKLKKQWDSENNKLQELDQEYYEYSLLFCNFEENILPCEITVKNFKIKTRGSPHTFEERISYSENKPCSFFKENNFSEDELLKNIKSLKEEELVHARKKFKVHLQLQEKYLYSFVKDFVWFCITEQRLNNINIFKVTGEKFSEEKFDIYVAVPIMVVYLEIEDTENFYKKINPIIDALVERYGDISKIISLKHEHMEKNKTNYFKEIIVNLFKRNPLKGKYVVPRFNRSINELIYIAGGDADTKILYRNLIKDHIVKEKEQIKYFREITDEERKNFYSICETRTDYTGTIVTCLKYPDDFYYTKYNNLYTKDFAFFLGYEYTYIPPDKRKGGKEEKSVGFVDKLKSSIR
jgi:hypothetical protein